MKLKIICLLFSLIAFSSMAQTTEVPYFNSNGNQTSEYKNVIKFYTSLSAESKNISITMMGQSDASESIYLVKLFNNTPNEKINILINNGIHPGEPEGIDACMVLAKNILLVQNKQNVGKQKYFSKTYKETELLQNILDHVNIYIIPIYNVDGSLRRNSSTRANQNGPEEYGFRGNARNLDLNRDFIKMDSRNAKVFASIFHQVKPHLFIDTHTSNGADYQHIVTYIATQKNKLQKDISKYQYDTFIPKLNTNLAKVKFDPVPYVNAWSNIPDSGWAAFYESPRFSTGYTTLFNTMGFTLETHMLKSYKERVEGSYAFLINTISIANIDYKEIIKNKIKADDEALKQKSFVLNWKLDSSEFKYISFKGYEAKYKKSDVSGENRLYYDKEKPFTKNVKFYENYSPTLMVEKPFAYIIPYAWQEVIDRLRFNRINMTSFDKDTTLTLGVYYIDDYKTVGKPYEGHYLHSNVKLSKRMEQVKLLKGDFIVYTNQPNVRYIVETLEPQGLDSYFNWNFFDATLSQKEYFSDYVFEDTAAEILKNNPNLKSKLEKRKQEDSNFAKSPAAQLDFIYRNSDYFEKSFMRYPVFRLER